MVSPPVVPPSPRHPDDDEDDRDRSRAGLYFLLGFLLIALIGGAAYFLPQVFEQEPTADTRVPNLIGLSENQARNAVVDAGLTVGDVSYEPSEDAEQDRVIQQEPDRDEYVEENDTVDFVVSSGRPMVTVPSVLGQQREAARAALTGAGLRVTPQEQESDEPAGQVLETKPAAGESVPEGTAVTMIYSDGPEEVPDVVGLTRVQAEQALRAADFEVFVTEDNGSTEPKGTVIRQNPAAGATEPEGTAITIVISAFEEPEPTPTETPSELPTESPSPPPTP